VRVRIIKPMVGLLDRYSLTRFTPGLTYVVADASVINSSPCRAPERDTSNAQAIVIHYTDDPN